MTRNVTQPVRAVTASSEQAVRVSIDLNVRVKGNQAMAGFEDFSGMVAVGDTVEIYEAECGLRGTAVVNEIDSEKRLVYMITDWHMLEVGPCP